MKKQLIEEGGSAVNGRPIQHSEVPEIIEKVNSILDSIGLTFHDDYESCGSAGKKKIDKTSGDIDFIVNKKKLIEVLNLESGTPTGQILTALKEKMEELGYNSVQTTGFGLLSVALPVNSPEDIVQVDLILAGSMEFARFFQSSPDYTKDESKYKAMMRNMLLLNIASTVFRRTTKEVTLANGFVGPGEIEQYSVRLNDGLYKTRKNWIGKRNRLVKTKAVLREYDELIYDTPQEFVNCFFKDTKKEELISFESSFELFMSDRFKYPEFRDRITVAFVMSLIGNAQKDGSDLIIPDEIDPKYVRDAENFIKQGDETYLKNKNSDIVSMKEFEGLYIKSYEKFLNEQRQETITVTFKEVYMKHEVTRTCGNMSKDEVIAIYGLNNPDIEWYQFEGEEKVFNGEI
jgi:hypothetical protein